MQHSDTSDSSVTSVLAIDFPHQPSSSKEPHRPGRRASEDDYHLTHKLTPCHLCTTPAVTYCAVFEGAAKELAPVQQDRLLRIVEQLIHELSGSDHRVEVSIIPQGVVVINLPNPPAVPVPTPASPPTRPSL